MEGSDHVSLLRGETPGFLKKPRGKYSKDKSADVRQVCDTTGLHRRHRTSIQELQ